MVLSHTIGNDDISIHYPVIRSSWPSKSVLLDDNIITLILVVISVGSVFTLVNNNAFMEPMRREGFRFSIIMYPGFPDRRVR